MASTTRTSEPRERLLRVASGLFYTKGIHAVGVDEVVATAGVTRSTMYRHFPGKEELVVAYLEAASQAEREHVEGLLGPDLSPEDTVRAIAGAVAAQLRDPAFRGCAFLNAAVEYPGPDHPVHRAVLAHRRWFHDLVADALRRLVGTRPSAELFVMLRDGAMAAGCVSDPGEASNVFLRGVDRLLTR